MSGGSLLAGIVALLLMPGLIWAAAGIPLLIAVACLELRRLLRLPRLCWQADGSWLIECGAASWRGSLHGRTVVLPWLVVLVLANGKGKRIIPLACDAVPSETWRLLRAGIRMRGATAHSVARG